MVNLHDIRRCPTGVRCECCGTEEGPLRTVTADIPPPLDGVICLTACTRCAGGLGNLPPLAAAATISAATAARLVTQHCCHLGILVEDMREQMVPLRTAKMPPQL
jgi:hypothetical protein